ncbi:MAG: type II toxin-antitoxin system HipA family toxin [Thermoanaerobaculia bacterium]|nr:type II toxin-antitoxin system HipA family toxin [Thermoanaerobaculia bacterium]
MTSAPDEECTVGRLSQSRRGCFFEYDPAFLAEPLWLSPFKLPPEPGLMEHRDREFGPLFGLFDDSLPDGWGRLLMDHLFQTRGVRPADLSALDRLAFLGTRTLGALTYHPPADPGPARARVLDLREMAAEAKRVLSGRSTAVLPELARAGGSPGGAHPKVLVGVRGDEIISGESDLPEGLRHWIVKFHGGQEERDAGTVEFSYSKMARRAGISMPPSRLFETQAGEQYFGVERFDREGNRRLHTHTFGNLIHANFRIPSCDYRQLLETTRILTRNHQDVVECLRRLVFNVATHNRDDHVKNFTFMMSESGDWHLAPAYDLTFSPGPRGEHSMTVAGEGKAPSRKHILELAQLAGVKPSETRAVLEDVLTAVGAWDEVSEEIAVSDTTQREIGRAIRLCCEGLR